MLDISTVPESCSSPSVGSHSYGISPVKSSKPTNPHESVQGDQLSASKPAKSISHSQMTEERALSVHAPDGQSPIAIPNSPAQDRDRATRACPSSEILEAAAAAEEGADLENDKRKSRGEKTRTFIIATGSLLVGIGGLVCALITYFIAVGSHANAIKSWNLYRYSAPVIR